MQKILLDKFPWNFYIWSAIVNDACMQKNKIGHRANFRAKYKCFTQILFLVRAILRSINFRSTDFNTDSADVCILVMACVDCACAWGFLMHMCDRESENVSWRFTVLNGKAFTIRLQTVYNV